ncbi:hypothetical protein RHSIM_Rhsim03G0246900 [Rhododendron simsii]|uniref:Retroviral polymerase SH3-like domain-containing protein n=1 Tax=Rhododendron simsii TaxID=118357 RepID=A0A834LSM5_RHOSS|nr:hypothetical protein RHSIM_Rhsim03G0246900 [Rhododendron simsii]
MLGSKLSWTLLKEYPEVGEGSGYAATLVESNSSLGGAGELTARVSENGANPFVGVCLWDSWGRVFVRMGGVGQTMRNVAKSNSDRDEENNEKNFLAFAANHHESDMTEQKSGNGGTHDSDNEEEEVKFDELQEAYNNLYEESRKLTKQNDKLASKNEAAVADLSKALSSARELQKLGKFDSRSDEGIFLGYSPNSRAFRVFNLRTSSVIESINVVIDDMTLDEPEVTNYECFEPFCVHEQTDQANCQDDGDIEDGVENDEEEIKTEEQDDSVETGDTVKPSARVKLNHPETQVIGKVSDPMKTRRQIRDEFDTGMFISQYKYAKGLVSKFGLESAKHARSLLYLTASRPDIAFSVGVCARYQASPKESHLSAVKRIIKYFQGRRDLQRRSVICFLGRKTLDEIREGKRKAKESGNTFGRPGNSSRTTSEEFQGPKPLSEILKERKKLGSIIDARELKRVPRPKDEVDDDQEKGETKSSVPNRPSQVRVEQRQHNSMYRTMKEDRPTMEPPSPKVSGCGFCGMFGNSEKTRNRNRANRKR